MKENVLDVLLYLFENYLEEDEALRPDQETLRLELVEAGFPDDEIQRAFSWLGGLSGEDGGAADGLGGLASSPPSVRVYSPVEAERMDIRCRGFLMLMEQSGVLGPAQRELVIDRIMALEPGQVDLDQLKWVILLVLFNQPGQESAFRWKEHLVMDGAAGRLH